MSIGLIKRRGATFGSGALTSIHFRSGIRHLTKNVLLLGVDLLLQISKCNENNITTWESEHSAQISDFLASLEKTVEIPAVKDGLLQQGADIQLIRGEDYRKFIQADVIATAKFVQAAGLKAE